MPMDRSDGAGDPGSEGFGIGEVAQRSGITARALRLLEAKKVLVPERSPNGYRRYTADQLKLAEAIRAMRAAGLSSGEVARIAAIKSRRPISRESLAELAAILESVEGRLEDKRKAVGAAIRMVAGYRREIDERRNAAMGGRER
jgi:MerR family transcriptional regulator, copper efflux regulator